VFADAAAKYTGVEELTREMLLDLIERIVVCEANGKRGSEHSQEIEICFRFAGRLPEAPLQNYVP